MKKKKWLTGVISAAVVVALVASVWGISALVGNKSADAQVDDSSQTVALDGALGSVDFAADDVQDDSDSETDALALEATEPEDVSAEAPATDTGGTASSGSQTPVAGNDSGGSTTDNSGSGSGTPTAPATDNPSTDPPPSTPPVTPTTPVTPPTPPAPAKPTVTLYIEANNAGNGVILSPVTVEFTPGETVYDVLNRECRNRGIQMESMYNPVYGSRYIEGIANLYEFDRGSLSGWMYEVNGWYPNYGCSVYYLKDGDSIGWHYTTDLGHDLGAGYAAGQ